MDAGKIDPQYILKRLNALDKLSNRLSDANLATHGILNALIASHPNPSRFVQAIDAEREHFFAAALPKSIPDSTLDYLQAELARVSALARGSAAR